MLHDGCCCVEFTLMIATVFLCIVWRNVVDAHLLVAVYFARIALQHENIRPQVEHIVAKMLRFVTTNFERCP